MTKYNKEFFLYHPSDIPDKQKNPKCFIETYNGIEIKKQKPKKNKTCIWQPTEYCNPQDKALLISQQRALLEALTYISREYYQPGGDGYFIFMTEWKKLVEIASTQSPGKKIKPFVTLTNNRQRPWLKVDD